MICRCGNEASAWLCVPCADRFEARLGEVAEVVGQVEAVIPRLTLTATYGDRAPGVKAQHAPAPVKIDAVSDLIELRAWLLNLGLRVAQQSLTPIEGRTHAAIADYVAANMKRVKTFSNAQNLADEFEKLIRQCENLVRVAESRVFAGNCPECQTDLYARKGDKEARCPTCGATYEVLKWREGATAATGYYVGTPAELSRALSHPEYNLNITVNQICMWATSRHNKPPKLERANETTDPDGQPLKPKYRLRDVLELNATKRKPLDGTAA